jgi:nucleoid DNA-binding protein
MATVTKANLVNAVYSELNGKATKADCVSVVDSIFSTISGSLVDGEGCTLQGFGSFKTVVSEARVGHNPQTGERIDIPEKNRVKFTASKFLKDSIQ